MTETRNVKSAGGPGLQTPRATYDQNSTFVGALIFVYVGTFFLQAGARIDFLGQVRFEFMIAALLLVIVAIRVPKLGYQPVGIASILTAYLIIVAIHVPFSVDFQTSYSIFVDRVLKFSAMGLILGTICLSPNSIRIFIAAFLLSCFKMGQEGFIGITTGSMLWLSQGIMRLHGTTSLYLHPNSFAGMALGTLPFIFYYFRHANKYVKIFLAVLGIFSISIILYTGSRTAYAGFFAFIAFVIFKSKLRVKHLAVFILIFSVSLPFVPDQYTERFESIFTSQDLQGQSIAKRKQTFRDAIEIAIDSPFGVGVAAFPFERERRFGRRQDTHNLYLEVATNLGIVGLVIFLLLVVRLYRFLADLIRNLSDQIQILADLLVGQESRKDAETCGHLVDLQFMRATAQALLAYLFIRLTLGLFGHDLYEIYWWVVIGLLVALLRCNQVSANITTELSRRLAVPIHPKGESN